MKKDFKNGKSFIENMKAKKIVLSILMLSLFMISVSASIDHIGQAKQYDCITLPQTCNCTWNNITTIITPNKSMVVINGAMTRDGTFFNYTFCGTSDLGEYLVNGVGDKDGSAKPFNYRFEVTTTGKGNTNTIPLFLLLGGVILFVLALYQKNEYIGLLSGFLFIVGGVYMMIFGLGMFSDLYTQTISYVSLGIGLIICFVAVVEMFYTPLGVMGDKDE